ncbi:MAG: DUF3267 domain-containing protein [Aureispira sp.]
MEIKKELTASGVKLNIVLIPYIVVCYLLLALPYYWWWGVAINDVNLSRAALVAILVACIFVHEAMHGFTWMWAGKLQWSDIKYGFIWKALMPFAHSKKPLSKKVYQLGAVMPGIVLGILPYVIGLVCGQNDLAFVGLIMTLAASGDAWILWMIRKESSNALILDHPSKPGCYVVVPASDSISIASSSAA